MQQATLIIKRLTCVLLLKYLFLAKLSQAHMGGKKKKRPKIASEEHKRFI